MELLYTQAIVFPIAGECQSLAFSHPLTDQWPPHHTLGEKFLPQDVSEWILNSLHFQP